MAMQRAKMAFLLAVVAASGCFGQLSPVIYPAGAHVTLYFPHLADGGPVSAQWQTFLEFVNPNPTLTANVSVSLFGDDGLPLSLDFGAGALSVHTFSIPPGGTIRLRSAIKSNTLVEGRATATSDIPIQGTVLFRYMEFSSVQIEVSAPATLPTSRYVSLATRDVGIALANISGVSKSFQVAAVNSSGGTAQTAVVSVFGLGHKAFNLFEVMSDLPADFSGSIVITPQIAGDQVVAWTLNADRSAITTLHTGVISTLPSGPADWPISHPDRIRLVYKRLLAAAPSVLSALFRNDLTVDNPRNLVIGSDALVNAFMSSSQQTVQINLALSELVSDSPSELAFLVGHELGHLAQSRSGALTVLMPNDLAHVEPDADLIAMILVLNAGFDPYGAAGAIAKLGLANGSPGLVSPFYDNLADPSSAFSQARINSLVGTINSACTYVATGYCASFKSIAHPHFPASPTL